VIGAPHAIPRSPGLATCSFLGCAPSYPVGGRSPATFDSRAFLPCGKAEAEKAIAKVAIRRCRSPHSCLCSAPLFPLHVRALVARQRFRATWDYMVEPTLRSACSPEAASHFLQGARGDEGCMERTRFARNPARYLYTVRAHMTKSESERSIFHATFVTTCPL